MGLLSQTTACLCMRAFTASDWMLGNLQEFNILNLFKDDQQILQVLGYDNGLRKDGQNLLPHLYTEFLQGTDLKKVIENWTKVRTHSRFVNCIRLRCMTGTYT
jgi:hypothetical protein